MKTFLKIVLLALAVSILSNTLPGISVEDYVSSIIVAVVI